MMCHIELHFIRQNQCVLQLYPHPENEMFPFSFCSVILFSKYNLYCKRTVDFIIPFRQESQDYYMC